jgi:hypothetical protein
VSEAVSAAATPAFAPSELVVLFGDRFTAEAGVLASKEEVLTSGVKVNSEKLMNAAMAAALFAVHRSGAARLEVRAGKALFGLMKTSKLHVVRGTGAAAFPDGSLEARVVEAADAAPEVEKMLCTYIGAESSNPPSRVLNLMKGAMASRGLLEVEERKALKVFTVSDFVLPESTRAAAAREPLEPVQQLLREAEQREPELFKAVQKAIDGARSFMTESRD